MKSLCFFCSYFEGNSLPYFVKCYLQELNNHFNQIVLVTNEKDLSKETLHFLQENTIEIMSVKNEGFDFGMWLKAFKNYNIAGFERIGLINDSCILFSKLDHVFEVINKSKWDYCGILDSIEIGYHPQSYFLIINEPAIKPVADYFKQHGIKNTFDEVIQTYEIGVSSFLAQQGLSVGSVYSYKDFNCIYNSSFYRIKQLIADGFPMIKKKIIFGNYRTGEVRSLASTGFDFKPKNYLAFINRNQNERLILDFNKFKDDLNQYSVISKRIPQILYWTVYYKIRNLAVWLYRKFIK